LGRGARRHAPPAAQPRRGGGRDPRLRPDHHRRSPAPRQARSDAPGAAPRAGLAGQLGPPPRAVYVEKSRPFHIPNLQGGITAEDAAPNRRGAELAGLVAGDDAIDADRLLRDGAADVGVLLVADSDFGPAAHDPATVERLRQARTLIVLGWAGHPLAAAADLALPVCTHAEKDGTFVNNQHRLQRFRMAFPPPGETRPLVEVLAALLQRLDPTWRGTTAAEVFDLMAAEVPAFAGLSWSKVPATG